MELREIIVITDGKSNIGGDPVDAARLVHKKGIIVNTIGITGKEEQEEPFVELDGIARAGGGICDIIPLTRLGYSIQTVTRKSVQMTIEKAVSRQLRKITGYSLDEMEPDSRTRILEYIQRVGDEVDLRCVVLLDCSGSMKNRIKTAVNSIQELLLSLRARRGRFCLGIVVFPGDAGRESRIVSGFTSDFEELALRLDTIKVGGATPTYAGIIRASEMFDGQDEAMYPDGIHEGSKGLRYGLWQEENGEKPFIL
jgi:Ca-activated chloride channel family protein